MKAIFLLILSILSCSDICGSVASFGKRSSSLGPISLYRLLASPESFDGRLVYVDGFLVESYGAYYIFPMEEDAKRFRSTSGFKISFDMVSIPSSFKTAVNGRLVLIEGRFQRLRENEEIGVSGGYLEMVSFVAVVDEVVGGPKSGDGKK